MSINYKPKLQQSVALSSTESELYATCEEAKNVKFVRSMMSHLCFKLTAHVTIYEYNAVTITVGNNDKDAKRLRHVDLRYFHLLDWVKYGDIV